CDSDGYASSVGMLSWYFSDGRQQPVSFSGLLERGKYSDGELMNMRDFPTESIGRFENGRLDGEGKICFPTAGTCRFGTFSEGIYKRGSGFLLFEKYGDKYYGSFRRGLPNGEGRKVFNDHPRYLYWDGRWENGTFVSGHKEPR
ncbi:MAG: hypothetical protein ABJH45_13455, partial [Paracoccaceae bacterium]